MIPKTFHRVWLQQSDDDVIPERYEYNWRRLKQLHPDWQFVTWEHEFDLFTFMRCRDVYDRQTTHAGRSDIARYEIMAAYGGVYLDTDVEPLKSFDPLITAGTPFAGWEDKRMICPTVLGGPPNHPAFTDLLDRLPGWAARYRGRPPNQQTGPHLLTACWATRPDVRLFPPVTLYPVHWAERAKLGGPYPKESYCVHHWDQSWDTEAKARIDARQG